MEQEFKTIISESSHIFDDFQFISSLSLEGLGNLQKKIINNAKELLDASKDSKRIPRLYLNVCFSLFFLKFPRIFVYFFS